MSTQRFSLWHEPGEPAEMEPDDSGAWVRHEDYEKLLAKVEAADRLADRLDEIAANESFALMFNFAELHNIKYTGPEFGSVLRAYRAAGGDK